MNRRDSVLAATVAVIWGVNFVVIHWGMGDTPPLLFAAMRFSAVVVPAIFFVPRPQAPWKTIIAVGATMSFGQFALLYSALHAGMPTGLASLVLQAQVVFTIIIAAVALGDRPRRGQIIGVALGVVGLVVVGVGRGGDTPTIALVLSVLAALSWGSGNVISRASGVTGGLSLTVWSAAVVPVPLLALSLLLDGPTAIGHAVSHLGWQAALSTLYTAGLSSLVGYGVFNTLLSRYAPAHVVPWTLLVPPVGMTSSWLLLGEAPNAAEITGGALLLAGVAVATRVSRSAVTERVGGRSGSAPALSSPR